MDSCFTHTLHITDTGKKQYISLAESIKHVPCSVNKLRILCDAFTQVFFTCAEIRAYTFLELEIELHASAHVELIWQQETLFLDKAVLRARFFVKEGACLKALFIVNKKNNTTQLDLQTFLLEPYARAFITTVHVLDGQQEYNLIASSVHTAAHTISRLTTRGIVAGSAKTFCKGMITIEHEADYSDAAQYTKQLIFGSLVRVENLPLLEVHTKKVSCKHGSAVGSINLDDLWYLASRGIGLETAHNICKEAFLRSALEDSGLEGAADEIMNSLR